MSSLIPGLLPDFISQPFFHGCMIKSGSGLGTRLSDVRRIRRKTHGTAVLSTVRIHNWSTRHRNEARQWSLAVYSGFAMQLINHLMDESFLPQRTGICRPQYYLAYACCMKPEIHPSHTELPEIHPFSITQYWLLIIILIPCLLVLVPLDVLHTIWCTGLYAEIRWS